MTSEQAAELIKLAKELIEAVNGLREDLQHEMTELRETVRYA